MTTPSVEKTEEELTSMSLIDIEKERAENERKIKTLKELSPGDHIVIVFNDTDYFHSILVSTQTIDDSDDDGAIIEIIFYNNDKLSIRLQELIAHSLYLEQNIESIKGSYAVKRAKIVYDKEKFEIYQVIYNEACLSATETIDKAINLISESKYNAFENNDEHFAIYCKSGKAGKLFVMSENDSKDILGTNIFEKIAGTLKRTGTHIVLFNVAQRIASRFPRNIVATSLPAIVEKGTPWIGYGLEGLAVTSDIHAKYKEAKEGKLTDIKFKKYVVKRVSKSTMSIVGGFGGAVAGQLYFPILAVGLTGMPIAGLTAIPAVGAMVGGFLGSVAGGVFGWLQGAIIGEVVETVDHMFLNNLSKEHVNILDNLSLSVDDVNECEYVFVDEKDCIEDVIPSNEPLNHDDYDIYLFDSKMYEISDLPVELDNELKNKNETISVNFVVKKPKID